MKLALALLALSSVALVGCNDDSPKSDSKTQATYPAPSSDSTPVAAPAPAPAPAVDVNDRAFGEKVEKLIEALQLPKSAELKIQQDPSKQAQVFVGLRCEIFLNKLKRAKKGPTNLYDAAKLDDVCSNKNLKLVPGASVIGSQSSGFIFPMTTSTRIAVRPDFTVSGFETTFDQTGLGQTLGHTVETVVIDGNRKVQELETATGVDLDVTELSGRYVYQSRLKRATRRDDASNWQYLEINVAKTNHKIRAVETRSASNDMAFTIGRAYKVKCDIDLIDAASGKTLNSAHLNEPCF